MKNWCRDSATTVVGQQNTNAYDGDFNTQDGSNGSTFVDRVITFTFPREIRVDILKWRAVAGGSASGFGAYGSGNVDCALYYSGSWHGIDSAAHGGSPSGSIDTGIRTLEGPWAGVTKAKIHGRGASQGETGWNAWVYLYELQIWTAMRTYSGII